MFVCCERCVLSRRGICDELITRPEESYRLWRVVVCDLVNLMNEEALAHWGLLRQKKIIHTTLQELDVPPCSSGRRHVVTKPVIEE